LESARVNMEIFQSRKEKLREDVLTTDEFSQIYEMYFDRVYKYICYRVYNQYEAEDICSQVFETVITKYHTFSKEKAKFDVWLFAIARNTVTDYYRARNKRFHFSLDSITELVLLKPSPEELAIRDDEHQAMFRAMAKLRDKERNIIAMKFAAGLKNSEIADLMGISESNIGVVVYRILKKLRKFLEVGRDRDE